MLDDDFAVDLSGIQDMYVMQKLNKMFKCLKLKRTSEEKKLEFKKRSGAEAAGIHDFKMKTLI